MKYFVALVILFSIIKLLYCDLPIHCLKNQITGKWLISAERPTDYDDLYKFTCSHTLPSHERDAFSHRSLRNPEFKLSLELKNDDSAILVFPDGSSKEGKWTMVYNEGFDILIDDYSFFSFFRYDHNMNTAFGIKSKWVSQCFGTLVGWYHSKSQYGCFLGQKVGKSIDEVTNGEPDGKLIVVENTVKKVDNSKNRAGPISIDESGLFNEDTFFFETSSSLKITSEFKDHSKVIDRVNSLTGGLWKAKEYSQFKGMSIKDLNTLAGRKKSFPLELRMKEVEEYQKSKKLKKDLFMLKKYSNYHVSHQKSFLRNYSNQEADSSYSDMPKNFLKWRDFMPTPRNQVNLFNYRDLADLVML
jgi:cathepsin C